jgi:DNA polymerase elongation subunit (family B)
MIKKSWLTKEINFVLNLHRRGFSRKDIARKFNDKYPANVRTQDSIKHCIEVYGSSIEKSPRKVLILDIETKPMTAKVWGLFDQNISLNQIVDEGGIFSWSAKWIDSNEVLYKDVKGNKSKEKELLKPIWKLMDEADIIIGQNSDSFDIKKLNAKFLEYKLGSPSDYKKIDTLKLAKKHFKFVSNKLEWMSKKFCKLKKLAHSKFPGFMLWDECGKGNVAAWKEMELYNKMDVLATEELFIVLSEFDKTEVVQDALKAYRSK